jgi:transcriptional regulator with XRE-family HTH domain
MTVTQDFPTFLRHAMNSAGYRNVAELSRASGIGEPVLNRWLSSRTQPTIELLRPLVDAIHVPLLQLLVVAGRMTAIEAGLAQDPSPPGPPPTVEDEIRSDPYLSDDKKDAMIAMLRVLRSEYDDRDSTRKRKEA